MLRIRPISTGMTLCGVLVVAATLHAEVVAWDVAFQQPGQVQLNEATFNQLVSGGRSNTDVLEDLDRRLRNRLEEMNTVCTLTGEQQKKLELAGRGDIDRFACEVEELQEKYVGKAFDQHKINEIYQEISLLGQQYRKGILGEGSLFCKIRETALDEQQRAAYAKFEAEQIQYRYDAKVKLLVAGLDLRAPMLEQQRRALVDLLIEATQPPPRWGTDYDWYYVLYQASTIPTERLSEALDAAQLRCFEAAVRRGAQMRTTLEAEGLLPERAAPVERVSRSFLEEFLRMLFD